MYNTYGNYYGGNNLISTGPSMGTAAVVWSIISLVAALAGCFVVYFVFVQKKENPKQPFFAWLKEFLRFDKMMIEAILKISYYFWAIFITLSSFSLISMNFLYFLIALIGGNLLIRVIAEAVLIKIMIWKNTTEIKKHLK